MQAVATGVSKLERAPGLAPGKSGFAIRRFVCFGIARMKGGETSGIHTRTTAFTEPDAARYIMVSIWKVVLPRGLAPRTSAFARRRAGLLHFGSKKFSKTLRHAGAAPALLLWKRNVLLLHQ